MEIVRVDRLVENPKNPRAIQSERFERLKRSLESFPEMLEKRPLVVVAVEDPPDGLMVLGGNQRLGAIRELGWEEAPVERADEWTEEQRREFMVKDNVPAGHWDWELLVEDFDLKQLDEWGVEVLDLGEHENVDLVNDAANEEWVGMPAFDPVEKTPRIVLHFKSVEERLAFAQKLELIFSKKTTDVWSGWWPPKGQRDLASVKFDDREE